MGMLGEVPLHGVVVRPGRTTLAAVVGGRYGGSGSPLLSPCDVPRRGGVYLLGLGALRPPAVRGLPQATGDMGGPGGEANR